jgi:predicted transcriptional regulator
MAKPTKLEIKNDTPGVRDEDNETLAAIDEGVRDARAGRTLSAEEVRTRLPKWITTSFTRKER